MNTQQIISTVRRMPLANLEELVDEVLTIQAGVEYEAFLVKRRS